jgi:acyl carrier protein
MHGTQLSTTGLLLVIGVAASAFAISVYFMEKVRRRRYSVALRRVRDRMPCSDEEFVHGLGFDRMSREAEVALIIRQVFADSLGIPPEAIRQTTCFGRESDMLPLCDSLDTVEIVLQLEDRLNTVIPDQVLSEIPVPFLNGNMEETIRAILSSMTDPSQPIKLTVAVKHREEGRWIARVPQLRGVRVHGRSREEALANAKKAALRSLADRRGQTMPETSVTFSEVS